MNLISPKQLKFSGPFKYYFAVFSGVFKDALIFPRL